MNQNKYNLKMNVLFDASWLANHETGKSMHGGLRVTYELAKRLSHSNFINTDFTIPYLDLEKNRRLKVFVSDQFKIDSKRVILNNSFPVKVISQLNSLIKTHRGLGFLKRNYQFINTSQLEKYNVYHSPVEAIPDHIHEHKKIKPFLTALDLIPLVRPDLAYPGFYNQLYKIYQSITANTIVLCISESTKNDLLNYRTDLKEENVIVTYIAADRRVFFRDLENINTIPVLKKYNLEKNNYFFSLSALAKFKNTKHTIDSFLNYILEYNDKEIKLLVVGKSRELNYDNDIFAEHKNHPQIIFLDFLPESELSIIYSNAIAFLYMSLYEGFGLPILEAMQCGLPVICSNTSSMPEVIGNAGISIDPTDKDQLCDAMHLLCSDGEKRKKFALMGLERSELFSWEKYTSDVINAYQYFT